VNAHKDFWLLAVFLALRISLAYTLFVAYGPFVLSGQALPGLRGEFLDRFLIHWIVTFALYLLAAVILQNLVRRKNS
jgi:hypothetical protein